PDGQSARPVRVGLFRYDGMMDAVHARRDNELAKPALHFHRQLDVGVMKHHLQQSQHLPGSQRLRRNAEDNNLSGTPGDRENHFSEVEADGGRGIQVEIDMMSSMKAPEKRHL